MCCILRNAWNRYNYFISKTSLVILKLESCFNTAAHWKEEVQSQPLASANWCRKRKSRRFVWACGEAEAEDKQRSEGIMSDSSVPIEQWAHCIQMSKVLEKASGYMAP